MGSCAQKSAEPKHTHTAHTHTLHFHAFHFTHTYPSTQTFIKPTHIFLRRGLSANVRTYDTVLRGCVRCGDSKMALHTWGLMRKAGCKPSTASYEYLIKTLCENLNVDAAWKVVADMQENAEVCVCVCVYAYGCAYVPVRETQVVLSGTVLCVSWKRRRTEKQGGGEDNPQVHHVSTLTHWPLTTRVDVFKTPERPRG